MNALILRLRSSLGARLATAAVAMLLAVLWALGAPALASTQPADPGNSADAPGHQDDDAPGNSGDAPGHQDDAADAPAPTDAGDAPAPQDAPQPDAPQPSGAEAPAAAPEPAAAPGNGNGGGATHGEQDHCPNPHGGPEEADPGNAYGSTCDGTASGNGNGNGGGGGKPCAGCVGNADNHNPPGQQPDGSDHNNGYECDGNSGVGKTNPAHSGCNPGEQPEPPCEPGDCGTDEPPVNPPPDESEEPETPDISEGVEPTEIATTPPPPPPTEPTCPDGSDMPADGDCDSDGPTCPDGSAMPANGDCDNPPPPPPDTPTEPTPTTPPVRVLPGVITRPPLPAPKPPVASGALARTGVDGLWFVVVGLFGMAGGAVLLRQKEALSQEGR